MASGIESRQDGGMLILLLPKRKETSKIYETHNASRTKWYDVQNLGSVSGSCTLSPGSPALGREGEVFVEL